MGLAYSSTRCGAVVCLTSMTTLFLAARLCPTGAQPKHNYAIKINAVVANEIFNRTAAD